MVIKSDGTAAVAIATSSLPHDVTGGVREKLQTALRIILSCGGRTKCFVTNILSRSAYSVCVLGVLDGDGTEIVGEPAEAGKLRFYDLLLIMQKGTKLIFKQ